MKQTLEKLSILLLAAMLALLCAGASAEIDPGALYISQRGFGTITVTVNGTIEQPDNNGILAIPEDASVQITMRAANRYVIRHSEVEWYDGAIGEAHYVPQDEGSDETTRTFSFTMPARGVYCFVEFYNPNVHWLGGLPDFQSWNEDAGAYLPTIQVKAFVEGIEEPVNEAEAGQTVTLRVTRADHIDYRLIAYSWYTSDSDNTEIREDVPLTPVPGAEDEYTFVMPDHNVSFGHSECWVIGAHAVTNAVEPAEALVPLFDGFRVGSADAGTEIELYLWHYIIDGLRLTDANGEPVETYTESDRTFFTMPDSPVTLSGTALPTISRMIIYFSDVGTGVFTVNGEQVDAAAPGSEVTVEVRPGPGHIVSGARVTARDQYDLPPLEISCVGTQNGVVFYQFTMPEYPVWVEYWFDNGHTVSFDSNGGSEVAPQVLYPGDTAAMPEPPTHEELAFAGWYQLLENGETAEERFDFDTPINGDITLVARWCSGNALYLPDHVEGGTLSVYVQGQQVQPDANAMLLIAPGDDVRVTLAAHEGFEIGYFELWMHSEPFELEAGSTSTFCAFNFTMPDEDVCAYAHLKNPNLFRLLYLPCESMWNSQTWQMETRYLLQAFREGVDEEIYDAEAGETVLLRVTHAEDVDYELIAGTSMYYQGGEVFEPLALTPVDGMADAYTFVMPQKPVSFRYSKFWTTGEYSVVNNLQPSHGLAIQKNRVEAQFASEGDIVELVSRADYEPGEITVTGPDGQAVEILREQGSPIQYFIMPAHDVFVTGIALPVIHHGIPMETDKYEMHCTVDGRDVTAAAPGSLVTLSYTMRAENWIESIPRVDKQSDVPMTYSECIVPVTRGGTQNGTSVYTFVMPELPVVVESRFGRPIEVVFDSDGGSEVAPQISCMDGFIEEPEPPTREDDAFTGWYLVLEDGTLDSRPFDFRGNTAWPFGEDNRCVLRATWAKRYTIALPTELAGGSVSASVEAGPELGGIVEALEGDKVYLLFAAEERFELGDCSITQADGGDVTGKWGEYNGYTHFVFMMPGQDVAVQAAFRPAWPGADFTLPAFITQVDEEAFEGIAATAVLVPESCERIGARAFANCGNLEAIRIENAHCEIGQNAFAGCEGLRLFAPPNSPAQAYAETHDNCEFVGIGGGTE